MQGRWKSASGKLAEARRPRDDLAHLIRSDFVAAEPEKFTRDVLDFTHAQAKRHDWKAIEANARAAAALRRAA